MFNKSILQRRTFHYSRHLCEEWTKAGLRRMKKNDLVHLAKENHLNISGTKNDIIIQLLSHQTAKIVGSTTPTLHSIRTVVEKTDESPADAVDADGEWMKAFEMKVAQRGSRKPMSGARDHFTSTSSKPHPFNDAVKSTIVESAMNEIKLVTPKSTTSTSTDKPTTTPPPPPTTTTAPTTTTTNNKSLAIELSQELEGMDPAWVEAFDLKVGSRGARHHLTDTLTPSTPTLAAPLDELPFIKIDTLAKEDHPSTTALDQSDEPPKSHSKSSSNSSSSNDNNNNSSSSSNDNDNNSSSSNSSDNRKNTLISAAVGTGMLTWYIGGEKGLADIWHFFTSL